MSTTKRTGQWSPGTESPIYQVCQDEILVVRLWYVSGPTPSIGRDGVQPHIVYRPRRYSMDDKGRQLYRALHPNDDDKLEFHLDLNPIWCPFVGDIALEAGEGGSTATVYYYTIDSESCMPRPEPYKPSYSLVGQQLPVKVPRGAYAVCCSAPTSVRFSLFNSTTTHDVAFAAGEWPLGPFAARATYEPLAPTATIPLISFLVRY